MSKTIKMMLVALLGFLASVVVVHAKGTPNVANTVHNLSSTNPDPLNPYVTDSPEVCVFCHTPHGGTTGRPLWNRNDPASTWQFYDSITLSATVAAVATVNAESLMCLSCHDGSIATNRVINPTNGLTGFNAPQATNLLMGDAMIETLSDYPLISSRIGAGNTDRWNGTGDLRDDHPISFNYKTILDLNQDPELKPIATAQAAGVRFFPPGSSTEYRVECSSCHDPHVDYISQPAYTPFLITSNAGSNMCLGCHNK